MQDLHSFIELALLLAWIVGFTVAYIKFRGRNFGLKDLAFFGTLAFAADFAAYKLYLITSGGHSESAAYGALVALFALLGLIPIAAGLSMVAGAALVASLVKRPALRYVIVVVGMLAWLAHRFLGNVDQISEPGNFLNNDKLAGENWALESGATSKKDCDRQSRAAAFREGCYARLNH